MLSNNHSVLIHCICIYYILVLNITQIIHILILKIKKSNATGPRLVGIFGKSRDHIKHIGEDKQLSYLFLLILYLFKYYNHWSQ